MARRQDGEPGREGAQVAILGALEETGPAIRQRVVPRGDGQGPRAARKESGRLTLEADEMWSFIGARREMWWIWVAIDAETRQVVAMVAGDRSEFTARCLRESLPDSYRAGAVVFSDYWAAYAAVIPSRRHVASGTG